MKTKEQIDEQITRLDAVVLVHSPNGQPDTVALAAMAAIANLDWVLSEEEQPVYPNPSVDSSNCQLSGRGVSVRARGKGGES